ncbi:MAG: hypothetical protein ACREUF_19835, partial [Solimonas sp.]
SKASLTGVRDVPVARQTSASVRKTPSRRGKVTMCCFSQRKTTSCAGSAFRAFEGSMVAWLELLIDMMHT